MIKNESMFDLPIEEQRRIAKDIYKMPFDVWVANVKQSEAEADAFSAELDASIGVAPDDWSPEDTERFQNKIDSGRPG